MTRYLFREVPNAVIVPEIRIPGAIPDGLYTYTSTVDTSVPAYANVRDIRGHGAEIATKVKDLSDLKNSSPDIQQAINASGGRQPVWFPNGFVKMRSGVEFDGRSYGKIQGQSELGSVIYVPRSCPAFADYNNPRALFRFGYQNNTPGQAFSNQIENLTIIVDEDNPGFIAIDFISANTGIIKNLTIQCLGESREAIRFNTRDNCCTLTENVKIKGKFGAGITFTLYDNNAVFNKIYLEGMSYCGIYSTAPFQFTCSKIESNLSVPLIEAPDGTFELDTATINYTGSAQETAIKGGNRAYFKNISSQGYSKFYSCNGNSSKDINTISVNEEKSVYLTKVIVPQATGNLPLVVVDEYPDLDPYAIPRDKWVHVGNPTGGNDYNLIQNVINNNLDKEVLCGTFGAQYQTTRPLEIPANSSLKVILGSCFLNLLDWEGYYSDPNNKNPLWRILGGSSPLGIYDFDSYAFNMQTSAVHNPTGRTLIIENSSLPGQVVQTGGKLFIKDCCLSLNLTNVEAHIIDFNPDGGLNYLNSSKLKCHGTKSETDNVVYTIENGSKVAIQGFHHINNLDAVSGRAYFEISDSEVGFTGCATASRNFNFIVKDTKNGITYELPYSGDVVNTRGESWAIRYSNV